MATHTYIALFEPAPAGGYGVSFPDLPGCTSFGDALDQAAANAAEALGLHLEGMAEDGDDFPPARSLADIVREDEDAGDPTPGGVWSAVSVDLPDDSERVNVYLPKSLLRQIERFGARSGIDNRSTFFRLAARYYMAVNAARPSDTA